LSLSFINSAAPKTSVHFSTPQLSKKFIVGLFYKLLKTLIELLSLTSVSSSMRPGQLHFQVASLFLYLFIC
jgi:hypothetical protein